MNPVVQAVAAIEWGEVRGTFMPRAWYQNPIFRSKNGKVNVIAITLYADMIYWYRPTGGKGKSDGIGTQRFDGDKLHKDYRRWGQEFGFTKDQVQSAIYFLREKGLLTVGVRKKL